MFSKRSCKYAVCTVPVVLACIVELAFGNPPPTRQRDPISLDPFSPSITFGATWSDLYGDNPIPPGFGFDIGGPGPVPHVLAPSYGVVPIPDDTDAISNGEFGPNLQQVLYFSVDDQSKGLPGTAVSFQSLRRQQAGDRFVTNGRSSTAPAIGPFPAMLFSAMPGPQNLLSVNQTGYNEIPSIPPAAMNMYVPPAGSTIQDDMDALELNPIDLNGDLQHDTWLYFSLAIGSPTLGALGATPADILFVPPGAPAPAIYAFAPTMGLSAADDVDAIAVFEWFGSPAVADPGQDVALFSLTPTSPSLAGPDGVFGTSDDLSPADILVTNFTGTFAVFMNAWTLGLLPTDNVDALDVEPFEMPQVFDWWVQRFNVDIVFIPPPGWPPEVPANDFHIVLPGVQIEQIFDLWIDGFPNVELITTAAGVEISWWGNDVFPGQAIHIGWTISDTTGLPMAPLVWYWTRDGQPIVDPPDNVQRWEWETSEGLVDRLPNFSSEPIMVQRRINRSTDVVTMDDLLIGSDWWNEAEIIDPTPVTVPPESFFDVFFEIPVGEPETRTFSVMYDVYNMDGTLVATHLNALTQIRTPELAEEGACCFGAFCEEASEEFCVTWGGVYQGTGVPCEDVDCGPVLCPGDANCDRAINFFDIDPFVVALTAQNDASIWRNWLNANGYTADCDFLNNDTNGDGSVDFFDIDPFVVLLSTGATCP